MSVNALLTGTWRATKGATAHSKATVQPLLHAKHSSVLCKGCTGMEHDEGLPLENHLKHTQTKLRRHCLIQPSVCFQCCMCITVARKRQRCRSPTTLTVSAQGIIVNTYLLSVDKLPCKRWLGVHTEVIFFHLVLKLGSTLGQIFTNPRFTNARSQ